MADFPAETVASSIGSALTERSGALVGVGDTVPAGALILWRNTTANAHVITLANNATQDGLPVSARTVSLAASQIKAGRVNPLWGDANGRVIHSVDTGAGAATDVKYYVLGGV